MRKGFLPLLLVIGAALLVSPPGLAGQAKDSRKTAPRLDRYQVPAGTALLLKLKTPAEPLVVRIPR